MKLKNCLLAPYCDPAVLFLRLAFGGMIFLHGLGKASDLMNDTGNFPDPIGIGNTLSLALVTFAEFGCSIFVMIGLLSRLALVPLIFTMCVVVFIHEAHLEIMDKEAPILFLIAFSGLFISGPGRYSIDNRLFNEKQLQE